jgi:hypothetical protein
MNNQEKAQLYDNYIYESDKLQRENSKIKSENTGNIPPHLQKKINENDYRISVLVRKLEDLFN